MFSEKKNQPILPFLQLGQAERLEIGSATRRDGPRCGAQRHGEACVAGRSKVAGRAKGSDGTSSDSSEGTIQHRFDAARVVTPLDCDHSQACLTPREVVELVEASIVQYRQDLFLNQYRRSEW